MGSEKINFQSDSKKSGDKFEKEVLKDLKIKKFINIKKNVFIPGSGCEIDFLADETEYVEAKGGEDKDDKRPGAKRTDNVKKAIANAVLIKAHRPNIYYVVYFSARPIPNSYSDQMINTALSNKIIDEVRYLEKEIQDDDSFQLIFEEPTLTPIDKIGSI